MKPGCSTTRKERSGDSAGSVIESYRKKYPKASPADLSVFILDGRRRHGLDPSRRRRAALGKAPTYLYVFAWETPVMGLRSPHPIEIPFVFNHIDVSQSMVGPVSPPMRELEAATAGAWAGSPTRGTPITSGCRVGPRTRPTRERR